MSWLWHAALTLYPKCTLWLVTHTFRASVSPCERCVCARVCVHVCVCSEGGRGKQQFHLLLCHKDEGERRKTKLCMYFLYRVSGFRLVFSCRCLARYSFPSRLCPVQCRVPSPSSHSTWSALGTLVFPTQPLLPKMWSVDQAHWHHCKRARHADSPAQPWTC